MIYFLSKLYLFNFLNQKEGKKVIPQNVDITKRNEFDGKVERV